MLNVLSPFSPSETLQFATFGLVRLALHSGLVQLDDSDRQVRLAAPQNFRLDALWGSKIMESANHIEVSENAPLHVGK
jgi:hypothetical protein